MAEIVSVGSKPAGETEYDREAGLFIRGELVAVSMTVPEVGGVIVNVCGSELLLKLRGTVVLNPAPERVTEIVPVYTPLGVTTKFEEATF